MGRAVGLLANDPLIHDINVNPSTEKKGSCVQQHQVLYIAPPPSIWFHLSSLYISAILIPPYFFFKRTQFAIMGYTEVDQKAINTIRLLAVCFVPVLLPRHCPSMATALATRQ